MDGKNFVFTVEFYGVLNIKSYVDKNFGIEEKMSYQNFMDIMEKTLQSKK